MLEKLVVIVLPMYNEELSIPLLRKMFDGGVPLPPGYDYRIVAVNDGSRDGTLRLVNNWAHENKRLVVLSHTQNMGVGQAILTGFYEAIRMSPYCVVTLDADASHPGSVIRQMVKSDAEENRNSFAFCSGENRWESPLARSIAGRQDFTLHIFPTPGVELYSWFPGL